MFSFRSFLTGTAITAAGLAALQVAGPAGLLLTWAGIAAALYLAE